ncbi:MAG: hypothetical protein ABJF65_00185 [Reichenbachiella sp.]|uniref:hypothetical protein n=1 Tax=Reichenbachiella sp. TaxID=2184521 RepID=UPI003266E52C
MKYLAFYLLLFGVGFLGYVIGKSQADDECSVRIAKVKAIEATYTNNMIEMAQSYHSIEIKGDTIIEKINR